MTTSSPKRLHTWGTPEQAFVIAPQWWRSMANEQYIACSLGNVMIINMLDSSEQAIITSASARDDNFISFACVPIPVKYQ